jgi:hypothetical protein
MQRPPTACACVHVCQKQRETVGDLVSALMRVNVNVRAYTGSEVELASRSEVSDMEAPLPVSIDNYCIPGQCAAFAHCVWIWDFV